MKLNTSTSPSIVAAEYLASQLAEALVEQGHVLLLLAGGSAIDVYNEVPKLLDEDLDYSKLMVVMGDERWDRNPQHADSDWVHFTSSAFYHFLHQHSAVLVDILNGEDHQIEADKFNALLEQALENGYYVISMLGVGTDGHTAGILPADAKTFAETFYVDELAVAHELDDVHPCRITISPAMLKQADVVFGYVKGAKKQDILQTLADLNTKHPGQEWEEMIPTYPALLLSEIDAVIFTDRTLT